MDKMVFIIAKSVKEVTYTHFSLGKWNEKKEENKIELTHRFSNGISSL